MLADAREFVLRAWWVVTFPGLDDPDHRARVQPAGRRAARRARPEAQALSATAPWRCSRSKTCTSTSRRKRGVLRAVDGVSLSLDEGEVLGIVGESGSGKSVTMLALMGLVAFPGRVRAKRLALRRARPARRCPTASGAAIIGKDVAMIFQEPTTSLNPCFTIGFQLAETLRLHLGPRPQGGARAARSSCSSRSAFRRPASRLERLPAPAVGRHEPARDDRDGDRLQSAAADRRRADDGARRDDPGADPRPAARPAERARHGAGAGHAQHGRGRRDGAARRGDVRGTGGGGARRRRALRRARSTRTRPRCWRRCPSAAPASARLATIPGVVPGPRTTGRRAACSRRAARYATRALRASGRRCARGSTASCAATIRWASPSATRRSRATAPRRRRRAPHERRRTLDAERPDDARRRRDATCTRVYEMRRGVLREPARLHAVGGVSFSVDAGPHARGRRRIGLRQVDAGAHGRADREADGGHARARAASTP